MEIKKCEIDVGDVIRALETKKTFTLATCADNRVTIRPMSHVNDGLTIYFQTGADSLKMRQIRENPNVALCVGTYEIEGTAVDIGHPLSEKNTFFAQAYKAKHPGSFERYSDTEDEIIVKVETQRVRQWRYVNNEPVLAETEFMQEECTQ